MLALVTTWPTLMFPLAAESVTAVVLLVEDPLACVVDIFFLNANFL